MKKIYALAAAAVATLSMNAQMYVCGNGVGLGWEPATPLEVTAEGGFYTTTIADLVEFKISSTKGDWDAFNAGAYTVNYVEENIGTAVELTPSDANISAPWKGEWTIVVAQDFSTIKMTTTTPKPDPNAKPEVYVRGTVNGWAGDAETLAPWKFTYVSEDDEAYTYYFDCKDATTITTADEFKIADADWGAINYGAGGEAELDEEMVWNYNDNNTTVAADYTGTIEFVLSKIAKEPALVTFHTEFLSGINNIAVDNANAPVQYFNLQGVEVANPENGIYIRRQGNKATKVLVK